MAAVVATAVLVAACSGGAGDPGDSGEAVDPTTGAALPLPAPEGDAFYDPPRPLPAGEPGDLIWAQPVDAPAGARAWRVLYLSEAVDGAPIAVSGVVAAPDAPAPAEGRPVMTWAHGTTGTADGCAPSKLGATQAMLALSDVIRRGWVGVATDYEGLGTPGLHPYLVGESEGRGVLDVVRAAQQIAGAGASDRVVVWGVSQGGHAALFAGQIAADYAPDLDVQGVVAAAPPGNLRALGVAATAAAAVPAYGGFLLMVAGGYEAAYGDVSLDELLSTDLRSELVELLERECNQGVFEYATANPVELARSPLDVEPWPELLADNSVDATRFAMPILILQGEDDQVVPKALTDALVDDLCAGEVDLEYRTFPATGHGREIVADLPSVFDWAAARFADEPSTTTCAGRGG